ncbi:MAG TPA: hypothetical protein VD860_14875 [Azospirillum sp.]|nr:hypothetical protein [Azospirillum sp.]
MTKLVLDNLDATVLDELKRRADQHGWSLEDEARHILMSATGDAVPDHGQGSAMSRLRQTAACIRAETAGKVTSDVVALIREDRDR